MLLTTDPEPISPFEVNVKYWKLEDQPRCKEERIWKVFGSVVGFGSGQIAYLE
jgi:hypothetical protein